MLLSIDGDWAGGEEVAHVRQGVNHPIIVA